MQDFQKYKETILDKQDKSSKGSIDEKIKSLCNSLNKHKNVLTLSSCSGRISVLKAVGKNNKKLSSWVYITHEKASFGEIQNKLKEYSSDEKLIFKQEPTIIHIAFKNLEIGEKFLQLAKFCGFNRCGFISTQKKVVLECILAMPLSLTIYDKKLLITEEYLEYLIAESNERQEHSWKSIDKLGQEFKKSF